MASNAEFSKKHRKVLRGSFTRLANELEILLSKNPVVIADVELSWECLKPKNDELIAANEVVFNILVESDASEEDLLSEIDSCDSYKKRFTEMSLRTKKLLEPVVEEVDESVSKTSSIDRTQGKRKFKLPPIQFKQFDGNIREWLPFWSQFRKIHADNGLDNCDKIDYLMQATVPGSRARQIVESFPVIDENYEKIVDSLQTRFGREDLQIEVYVRELLKLVLNNAVSKEKQDLAKLYDQIETQLRALDSLGITSDKYASLLFPLIESCLPQEILRIWQRSTFNSFGIRSNSSNTGSTNEIAVDSLEVRLENLMKFLRVEVENEQRIDLASEGFGLTDNHKLKSFGESKRHWQQSKNIPFTAAGLVNTDVAKCIFCQGMHESEQCFKAQKMSIEERKKLVTERKACFKCLKIGHLSRKCRSRLQCIICNLPHVPLMCQSLAGKQESCSQRNVEAKQERTVVGTEKTLTNQTGTHVFLQTLRINLRGINNTKSVRALIDTGSQRSYILKSTALALNLKPKRAETITHCLFGGSENEQTHYCYDVTIFNGDYVRTIEVLDQTQICKEVSPIFYGPWMPELRTLNIEVSDYNTQGPIEMLMGADIAGLLYTGKRHVLKNGIVANETHLGWTVEGKVPSQRSKSMTVTSMLANPSLSELWQLDVLGIQEPAERKTKNELALAAKEMFLETVIMNDEGRYEVQLPWIEGHPILPSNYIIAKKRLETTLLKLERINLKRSYGDVFKEWEETGIIEKTGNDDTGHFLPHRPVIKEGSTTAIRPVFDASAHEKNNPSLNQCLGKGENLIELIPALLIKFREHYVGVISDIKKAFLQISVNPRDRQFLKFLWINGEGEEIVYRHNRVVFGVTCSPFMLGATLEYHLDKCLQNCHLTGCKYSVETIERLSKSFYVDNCVASVPNEQVLNTFMKESVTAMEEARFDLRGWEFSRNPGCHEESVSVLGLRWHPRIDTLSINPQVLQIETENMLVTKRKLLSVAQKVFDPVGFTSPTTLLPKLWLQVLWERKIPWDAEVDTDIAEKFRSWCKDLHYIQKIEIPRWSQIGGMLQERVTLHTFVDSSRQAYAAVVFCRVETDCGVSVQLLAAKSRVAPIEKNSRKLTIPRLELLGATIGARLYTQVIENLCHSYQSYFWSDSSTVVAWIQRNEEWGTFVYNRVTEIRKLTPAHQWHHIPGTMNPADLPSRGCSPKQLLESEWWEGPAWLYEKTKNWPVTNLEVDEEAISKEKKKIITLLVNTSEERTDYHLTYFSKFTKTVRMIAWFHRFIKNCKNKNKCNRIVGNLTVNELKEAENFIIKLIQQENFEGVEDKKISCLNPFYDEVGILRLRSRVSNRKDTQNFRYPILLPSKHPVVNTLIMDLHRSSCHVGVQGLLSLLRENYWIIGGRKSVRSVLAKCVTCKRFSSKPYTVESPPLPFDRVRDAVAFEITGVDFAGPLYLKTGEKAWVCLFTCAVFRAVHLELTMSLSTHNFLQVLRRFIARRGRPRILYSDNGTNFKGSDNAFNILDWNQITQETSTRRIVWKFNPPSAPWWGGFFERLIGIVKRLLRKVLGRASLNYEDLMTLICDCEAVVNARPLTYISNDSQELMPLTPSMFLREQFDTSVPDCDEIEKTSPSRKMRNQQKLRETLRQRFRLEYLGQLRPVCEKNKNISAKLNEVVLVGNDSSKRIEWPLGRVIELLPGKDGLIRLVRVRTARGELLRPVQRLYALECIEEVPGGSADGPGIPDELSPISADISEEGAAQATAPLDDVCVSGSARVNEFAENYDYLGDQKCTRSGRSVKLPARYRLSLLFTN